MLIGEYGASDLLPPLVLLAALLIDAMVGEFLTFLEQRVGTNRIVVVMTADHGVLPLPSWLQERDRSACPVRGGRINPAALLARLHTHLDALFGVSSRAAGFGTPARWFAMAGSRLTLDVSRVADAGASDSAVLAAARESLEAEPGIARVWTREEILKGKNSEPMATLYRNSWSPELTGDLALQAKRDCLLGPRNLGTTHGSPYLYDRAVPLIFFGPGIEPGQVSGPAATIDIAPTLAALLEIEVPPDLQGRSLDLR